MAIDPSSVIASTLILGLAVILAVLAQWSSANALSWIVAIIFLTAFGWIVFKTLWRRRLENKLIQRTSTGTFT
jgi:Flp pilus assembly protein TadB